MIFEKKTNIQLINVLKVYQNTFNDAYRTTAIIFGISEIDISCFKKCLLKKNLREQLKSPPRF